jgi:diguanylate cyclase (GGDEF)-like protein
MQERSGNASLVWRVLASMLLGFALVGTPSVLADEGPPVEPRFRHLRTEDGLSHDVVYGLVQDSRGFLWVGTEDGLDRYDGYETVHYGVTEGLPSEDVSCLAPGRDGAIWIGTWGQGVARLDPVAGTITRMAAEGPQGLTDGRIHAILEASDGSVWIGTYSGLNRIAADGRVLSRTLSEPDNDDALSDDRVWSIAEDRDGLLWLGTNRGLGRLDPKTGKVRSFLHDPARPDSLADDLVRVVYFDSGGGLWLGTGNGLARFDPATETFVVHRGMPANARSLSNNVITAILEDAGGALWLGTFDGGLNRLDPATALVTRYEHDVQDRTSISHSNVRTLLIDRSGVLWVGTRGGGLSGLDLRPRKFAEIRFGTREADLPRREVLSVLGARDGSLWVGMLGALVRYAPDGERLVLTREPSSPIRLTYDSIFALAEDEEGTLWIGTVEGLDVLRRGARKVESHLADRDDPTKLPHNSIEALMFDRRGRLWVGTRGGLARWDPSSRSFVRVIDRVTGDREPIWVRGLLEEPDGRIWVPTEVSGILRLDPETGRVERWSVQSPEGPAIDSDRVFAVERDDNGVIWAGTTGGLSRLDEAANRFVPTESIRVGARSTAIYAIRADSLGHLWLATPRGLLRYEITTGTVRAYDESDGLYSRAFSRGVSTVSPDGVFMFGAKDGLVKFRPDEMRDATEPPHVELTSLTVNGVTDYAASAKGTINLPPGRYDIAFRFAAFDLTSPESNRYQYRLAGFDDGWSDAMRPETIYRGLPPGRYSFHVRASNSDDVWSAERELVALTIEPPYWATLKFRSLLLLTLMVAAWWIVRRRTAALRRRSVELETLVSQRTEELERANAELARLAHTDGLTGLANHRAFQEHLSAEWRRAARSGAPLSLLLLDVDWFKPFNDLYGHQKGDDCLRAVGGAIAAIARRSSDTPARYGGEEFAILLPDTPSEAARSIAEALRTAVRGLEVPHESSVHGRVTASIGVASCHPSTGGGPEGLVASADGALYAAKNQGRDRVVVHEP